MHDALRLASFVALTTLTLHCGSTAESDIAASDESLPPRTTGGEPGTSVPDTASTPPSSSAVPPATGDDTSDDAPSTDVGGSSNDPGAGSDPNGQAPPPPACDVAKPFQAPTLLAGFAPDAHAGTPRLSPNELTIYFTMQIAGRGAELGMASRASRSEPFSAPTPLTALSTTMNDNNPSITADGLSLFFHSDRAGNNDLYYATRATTRDAFGVATPITSLNTTGPESQIYYRANGQEAWFVSPKAGTWDIYVAKRKAGDGFVFDAPTLVSELSSSADDWAPRPSDDGLSIVFISNRGAGGDFDLYMAKRKSTAEPFGAPVALDELNSPTIDYGGWTSPDGCRIYFSSTRGTPGDAMQRIWYAERPK